MISKLRTAVAQLRSLNALRGELDLMRRQLDALKSRNDLDDASVERFHSERASDAYQSVYHETEPLVSVCVATYNRGRLLVDRCLRSILAQDYRNLEVIVVGDCCNDDTAALLAGLDDRRIEYVNLPERGRYPDDPMLRWMVAGTTPINHALNMASGAFITHLDDDDEFTPDRIGKLLSFIQETKADLVWHPFDFQTPEMQWRTNRAESFALGQVTTSSIFYHNWLTNIPWDIEAYKYYEPGDWNRFRKIQFLGATVVRFPEILLKHYRERSQ